MLQNRSHLSLSAYLRLFGQFIVILALLLPLGTAAGDSPLSSLLPSPVPTIFVTTTALTDDPNDHLCDLYEALQATFMANYYGTSVYHECAALVGPNVIAFSGSASGGTISFALPPNTKDLPFIHGDTTILGPITFDGGGSAGEVHIFRTAPSAKLTLIGVVIKNAHNSGNGPAIYNDNYASVSLYGVSLISNTADHDGGAIESNGDLSITMSNLSGNIAKGLIGGTGYGGAIHFSGGGILSTSKTSFAGNIAAAGGGGLWVNLTGSSESTLEETTFNGNIAQGIGGGAIYDASSSSSANLKIIRSPLDGNLSPLGNGGALYVDGSSQVHISDSSFNANVAGSTSNPKLGGAIFNVSPSLTIQKSAFIGNAAYEGNGGALVVDHGGTALVANVTFVGNLALQGNGGALYVTNTLSGGPSSTAILRNVTMSKNSGKLPSGHAGGVFIEPGSPAHVVRAGNTIFDGNISGNCNVAVVSLGHNLDSGTDCGLDAAKGDISSGSAKLDTPGFNGGPVSSVLTLKLLAGSDAVDSGDPAICSDASVNNEDERGDNRPKDGDGDGTAVCDIGAIENDTFKPEFGSDPVKPGPILVGNVQFSFKTSNTFKVMNKGQAAMAVSTGLITGGANASDFSVDTVFPLPLSAGAESNVQVSCTPAAGAEGLRTATLTLTTTDLNKPIVNYDLQCNAFAAKVPGFGSVPAAPGPVDFGEVQQNKPVSTTISLKETGNANLTVSNPIITGTNASMFQVTTSFPITINEGAASVNVNLSCTPGVIGINTANLTLNTNDPKQTSVSFTLVCIGNPPPTTNIALGAYRTTSNAGLPAALTGPYGVTFSPDNQFAYISSNTGHIVTMKRGLLLGEPRYLWISEVSNADSVGGMLLAASPDGASVLVAGYTNDAVTQWRRNSTTGALTWVHTVKNGVGGAAGLDGAFGVAFSQDSQFAYVTGLLSDSVAILKRDGSGIYQYNGYITNSTYLNGARGITLSPDGLNVYISSHTTSTDGMIATYKRDPITGSLSFVQELHEGQCIPPFCFFTRTGFKGANQAVVSSDGNNVYLVSRYNDAIVVLTRDPSTGSLQPKGFYQNGVNGMTGLDGVDGIDLSSDGSVLYALSYVDSAVTVFDRDETTGLLSLVQVIQRDVSGLPPLSGGSDLHVSPDDQVIIAVASVDNAVVEFLKGNPKATLTSLAPASVPQGTNGLGIIVRGYNFMPDSVVTWAGNARQTFFVSTFELHANLSVTDLASAGTHAIGVRNPLPGGGDSNNTLPFVTSALVINSIPSISNLTPGGASAGDAQFTLLVSGSNFVNGATVSWNGKNLVTTYLNSFTLTAVVPASAIAAPGSVSVIVTNPAPGSGTSNAAAFDVAGPGENPVPTLLGLSKYKVFTNGPASKDLILTVSGQNFVEGVIAQWNGDNRPTKYISSTLLQMTVTGGDQAVPGQGTITVFNPGPGGGSSNAQALTVLKHYQLRVPFVIK